MGPIKFVSVKGPPVSLVVGQSLSSGDSGVTGVAGFGVRGCTSCVTLLLPGCSFWFWDFVSSPVGSAGSMLIALGCLLHGPFGFLPIITVRLSSPPVTVTL